MGCLHSVAEKGPAHEGAFKKSSDLRLKNSLVCKALHCSCGGGGGNYCSSFEPYDEQAQKQSCTTTAQSNGHYKTAPRAQLSVAEALRCQGRLPSFSPSFMRVRRRGRLDPRVGSKYSALSLIGKGSFSVVLKVRHRGDGALFAMKMMPANRGKGNFENELLILSRVRHQNVVQLIEVIRSSTRICVVLELASGGELYDRITQKGCYSEPEGVFAVRQILQGVSYLHRVGVTHRDLKPENLLYATKAPDSKVMITDFGLAHLQQGAGGAHMVDPCGTPEYIAPEILTRLPYTNKVDLWAVGVITYILLAGIMPFDDENRTTLYRQILRGKYYFYPEFWHGVSEEAKQFVAFLLCVDSDLRPSAEAALQHPWLHRVVNRSQLELPHRGVHKSHSLNVENKRTRSSRSVRSVARSDAGRRIRRDEVDRLHKDPEILKILTNRSTLPMTTNYGVV